MRRKSGIGIESIRLVGLAMAVLMGVGPEDGLSARLFAASGSPRSDAKPGSDLVVHEWGTFLGMSGSDGTALDGMYHEEHALPSFVHARSRDQLRLRSVFMKGETPVIYFYAKNPQSSHVAVDFPKGVWTQWYPQAARVQPSLIENAPTSGRLGKGRICWFVDIIPPSVAEYRHKANEGDIPSLPATSTDALWNFAREVDAAYVKTVDGGQARPAAEFERFLFYRGLGEAQLPLRLDEGQGGRLALERDPKLGEGVKHLFVVRIENGQAAYRYLPLLQPGQIVSGVIPSMAEAKPLDAFATTIATDMAERLTASGLFAKEARAMVNTWRSSYFQTEGIRVLFVLPQSWTDAFIPMTVTPPPKQVVRVMVGRLELLSRKREQMAAAAIEGLGAPDSARREEAFAYLRKQGRYVEPIIRRVLRTTSKEDVRTLCRRLLLTEFVTALRAAVHNAADGRQLTVEPLLLKVHLARLLREIGLDKEARAEGVLILNELDRTGITLTPDYPDQFGGRDLRAAALEAAGIDRSAAAAYEDCIRSYTQTVRGELDPPAIAWCRDWWIGHGYGRSVIRSGKAEATIAGLEVRLTRGGKALDPTEARLSRLLLAYIHEAKGAQKLADRFWSSLDTQSPAKTAPSPEPVSLPATASR
jgi:hypothetical protein